jgi:hypothetical protein
MACITARIAGKLATSLSRTPVATDPKRLALRLDADPRLAAAAGGAVRCLAELSGMSEEDSREFQSATVRACLASFESHNSGRHLVEFSRFEDRLEVVVDSHAGSAAIRLSRYLTSQS